MNKTIRRVMSSPDSFDEFEQQVITDSGSLQGATVIVWLVFWLLVAMWGFTTRDASLSAIDRCTGTGADPLFVHVWAADGCKIVERGALNEASK